MPSVTVEQAINLANEHYTAGRLAEAESVCRLILSVRTQHADALNLLGAIAGRSGRLDLATNFVRQALAASPDNPGYHFHLGTLLKAQGDLDQAIACYQRALALRPDYVQAYNNLANAWMGKGQIEHAIDCFQRALALHPRYAEAHNNLGALLADQCRWDQAIACFRAAIAINPSIGSAHHNLANVLLRLGDFSEGWMQYEWRWGCPGCPVRREFVQPACTGSPDAGQAILLTCEQGLGDTIQFIRYVPMVAERCRRVVVECPAELLSLLRGAPGIAETVQQGNPLPAFDAHCSLASLPGIFGTTLRSIPATVPYLAPDPTRVAAWSARLGADPRLKVGLAWAGRAEHWNDRNRSVALAVLAPLASVPGILFLSLQKGPASQQAAAPPPGMELVDHTADLHDFADTAALVANLDLVISVDTAIVHLAGALAKPVWTLLPFCPDWRWLLDRSDSPWYPTMRLFRQSAAGDWASVMNLVAGELRQRLVHP
jgi:Tfp pilus assembly protein PilF